jgi:hypothetical protein
MEMNDRAWPVATPKRRADWLMQASPRLTAPNSASTQSSLPLVEGNGERLMSSAYSSQHRLESFTNILPLKMWRILHLVNRGSAPFHLRAAFDERVFQRR